MDTQLQLHSTTVAVADQGAALYFYVNTLGWEKAVDVQVTKDMRFLAVAPPGADTQLVLGHKSWFAQADIAPSRETGIALVAPDVEAAYETLAFRGVQFKHPVATLPSGQRVTWFYDPDGNEFCLIAA